MKLNERVRFSIAISAVLGGMLIALVFATFAPTLKIEFGGVMAGILIFSGGMVYFSPDDCDPSIEYERLNRR